jgi:hypothetical protein
MHKRKVYLAAPVHRPSVVPLNAMNQRSDLHEVRPRTGYQEELQIGRCQ